MLMVPGGGHMGHWEALWWHLQQAADVDEELIVFTCILLFSVSVAVHLVAIGFRAGYLVRFLYPQLGMAYAIFALVAGSILRHLFHQPWDDAFHALFTALAVAGYVALFGRHYLKILRHE
jgi:hypothetical protein